MSAVSSESPLAAANLSAPSAHPSSPTRSGESAEPGAAPANADFGANEWLVDELYQRYLDDPGSVDKAWWSFFADYRPFRGSGNGTGPLPVLTEAASAAAAPAAAPPAQTPVQAPVQTPAQAPAGEPAPAPAKPAQPVPPAQPASAQPAVAPPGDADLSRLRGAAARTAQNMMASLGVPTATSVRAVPAKLLIDNRIVINNALQRGRGGKISFTHLIGYAVVLAVRALPEMNAAYAEEDGKPVLAIPHHVNLGLAIDLKAKDGSRQLLVPNIKGAEEMDFVQFWNAYEDVVRKARGGKLTVADFQGTTISLTNPGTIGTEHSVPRLMPGQGAIVGVGAMEYPAAYQGASEETMARLAISKTVTLTSTYDHRIIQGAQSGDFLRIVHQLLLGADGFYDRIFESLRIPYEPVRWVKDFPYGHEDDVTGCAVT
jgi:2-oxoglutarate dehydrogenase E1 component